MFWLIKQVFIALFSFSGSLAIKYASLSNESCMVSLPQINLNPVGLNCYPFLISLDNCNENCNAVDELSMKIYVSSK